MTRDPARIGSLQFTFADPAVDVTSEQRTTEHETVDDQIVIQTMGRRADQITINAVVTDMELGTIDRLTELGVVKLRTERWKGRVVVTSTSTTFKRAKMELSRPTEAQFASVDTNTIGDLPTPPSAWLYDASIECLEVSEDGGTRDRTAQQGSSGNTDSDLAGDEVEEFLPDGSFL